MVSMLLGDRPVKGLTKVVKLFGVIVRWVLPVAAIAYIVYSLSNIQAEQWQFWKQSAGLSLQTFSAVCLVLALTFFNWFFEAFKWQKLANKFENISLKKAYAGVLFGISLGMITPRRAGEFAGRVAILKPENQLKGLAINTAGSFTQFLVTLLFGHVGVALALIEKAGQFNTSREGQLLLYSGLAIILAVLMVLYAKKLIEWLQMKPWFPKKLKIVEVVTHLSKREMAILFSLSIIRYIIFIIQFHLLLMVFGVQLLFYDTFMVLSIIYLIMVGLPISGLAEAGIRGSVALFVFSLYLNEKISAFPGYEMSIVSATLLLWFFNLALPGIIGALLSMAGKVHQNKPIENHVD